jgi:acyl-coenzyme A synthetase/AMP-(fatty) acid ligase/acyl carrier protein
LPNPRARVLQFSSIGFDAALQEIYNSLSQGDSLVLLSEDARSDPALVHDLMKAHAVDHVYMPYVALSVLADYVGSLDAGYWPAEIFTAGEQLVVTEGLRRLQQRFPGCRLHNFYGPTETHVVSAYTLPTDAETWPDLPSIGTAIDQTRIHVLDAALNPVPLGGIGELYAGGLCLARGYLNQPGLTAERFIADPYGPRGTRMYATGDLVRRSVDGAIEFLGRRDGQVKIRGYRVEPVEVETTLSAQLPGAESLAVVAHQTGADTRLICFAKPRAGVELTPEMMQAAAVATLPSYMRPYANILIDAFPYTTSGKLNRRKLAEQIFLRGPDKNQKREPETDLQLKLCQAMGGILGRDDVGLDDNFFALGGSSLDAMRLLVRLTVDHGVSLSASDIFMAPTVAELVQRIEKDDKANSKKRNGPRKGQGVKSDA